MQIPGVLPTCLQGGCQKQAISVATDDPGVAHPEGERLATQCRHFANPSGKRPPGIKGKY